MKQEGFGDDPPDSGSYRWVMLALLWILYASFGIIYRSISPLITPILKDLDMSYGQMGLILGSWQLTYIMVATIAGVIIDKWGVRKSLFVGAIFMAASVGLRYFSRGFATLLPMVALFGVGGPMVSIGSPKTIAVWFKGRDRGTAVGIYLTGPWVGGAIALAATNRVFMPLVGFSWRLTFACYGLLTLGVSFLWWCLAREAEPSDVSEGFEIKKVFRKLIRMRTVRVVLAAGPLSFGITHGYINWLPKILETQGLSPTMAGFAASTPLLAGIPALLTIPRMVSPDRMGTAIAVLALSSATAVWMLVGASGFSLLAGLVLFGISACSLVPLLTLILMDLPQVGSRHMGSVGGMFFCISEIGGFMGSFVVGALVDLTGTFLAGAYFVVLLSLAVFVLSFFLKNPPVSNPTVSQGF